MTPERWGRVGSLYRAALERAPAERVAFLRLASGNDHELLREVESLLAAGEGAGHFLSEGAMGDAAKMLAGGEMPTLVGRVLGHHRVLSRLGAGGMGEVYLAEDTRLKRRVALKLLPTYLTFDPDRVHRFEREAQAVAALSHPHVCVIYEVVETEDGLHCIVMEYIEGRTLRELMEGGKLSLGQALETAVQVASALAAAHEAGIIHRDIKPENIMLRADGYAKVLDFGLAKLTERAEAGGETAETLLKLSTQTGLVMGTTHYMSPEQARGQKVDARTDVWSLGVVLYEMVVGVPPFEGETASDVLVSILKEEPAPIVEHAPDAPAELQQIIEKALRKKREERYPSMHEMCNDLREAREEAAFRTRQEMHTCTGGEASHAGRGVAAQSHTERRRSRAMLWAAVLAVAASVIAFGLYEYLKSRRAPPPTAKMERITAHGKILKVALSRDGRYVAYTAGHPRQQGLWVMQVKARSQTQLIPPAEGVNYWQLSFSPDGDYIYYVAFVKSEAVLYRVPTLGATPKRLLVNIDSGVAFSPDGQRMAFTRGLLNGDESQLVLANADGTGEQVIATRKLPDYFLTQAAGVKVSWSPDGESIACPVGNELRSGNSMEVVGVSVRDGTERPLTRQRWADVTEVDWLGDGSGLVMSAKDQLSSPAQVWHLSYPKGEARKITNDLNRYEDISVAADSVAAVQFDVLSKVWIAPGGDAARARQVTDNRNDGTLGLSWTPDGRVVYCSYASGNADIWVIDADGENPKRLTENVGLDAWPEVSPDGRLVVFVSDRAGDTFNVWRMDIDGGNPVQLTRGGGEIWPRFSPDGRWVYYTSSTSWSRGGPLWKVPIDGGEPVLLINQPTSLPSVSPDQKLIAYSYIDSQANPMQGTAIGPVGGGEPVNRFRFFATFGWTPDGRALAYLDDQQINVWTLPLDGGKPVQLTDFKSDLTRWFAFSRDGKQLALARGTVTSDVVLITDFK